MISRTSTYISVTECSIKIKMFVLESAKQGLHIFHFKGNLRTWFSQQCYFKKHDIVSNDIFFHENWKHRLSSSYLYSLVLIPRQVFQLCFESGLAPSLEWSPGPSQRAAPAARLVNFAGKVTLMCSFYSNNSDRHCDWSQRIFISQPSSERFHVSWMNRWIAIWPMFVAEYFPREWKWLCLQSVWVNVRD